MSYFDSQSFRGPCPHCSKQLQQPIQWFQRQDKITCSQCGFIFDKEDKVEALKEIRRAERDLRDFDRTMRDLDRNIRKLFK